MHKSVDKELLNRYLETVGSCYATGDFTELFPYLASDCVWESMWRLTPETGKEAVINYFNAKGEALRESKAFPKWMVVEFVDNLNFVESTSVKVTPGKDPAPARIGLYYQAGKLALFMSQDLEDGKNATIVDLKINEDNLIQRIDICDPAFFKFKKYDPQIKF